MCQFARNSRAEAVPVQKYDIRKPVDQGDGFEARYRSPSNAPVFDENGRLRYIVNRVEDATDFVRRGRQGDEDCQASGRSPHRSGLQAR